MLGKSLNNLWIQPLEILIALESGKTDGVIDPLLGGNVIVSLICQNMPLMAGICRITSS
jgi:hypothetical protein